MSNPVGAMYVELSLDSTKYTKAQKDILAGAEKNSADINKVMKTVGTQSDQMYNAMRQNIQNAYNAIAKSATSSADEIRRAHEGMNTKIAAIDKQQFGERASLLDSFKGHWLAATAAIAVAIGAMHKAWSLIEMGADFEEQTGLLDNLAKKYKTTANSIVEDMERASDGLISRADLMKISLEGLGKGLNPDQLKNLASAAALLGDVVGVKAKTALEDLTQALETGRVKGLKTYLGTTIDLETSFGELVSKMTAAEKANAMYSMVMIESSKLQAQQTGKVDETADKLERLDAKYANLTLTMATFLKTVAVGFFDAVSSVNVIAEAKLSVKELDNLYKMGYMSLKTYEDKKRALLEGAKTPKDETKTVIDQHQAQIDSLKKLLQARKDNEEATKKGASEAENAQKQITESIRKTQIETEGIGRSQHEKDVARIESEAEKYRKAGVDKVTIAKFVAGEMELANQKVTKEEIENWLKSLDAASEAHEYMIEQQDKLMEERYKGHEEYKKMLLGEYDFAATQSERAINAILAKEEEKLAKLKDLYEKDAITKQEYEDLKVKIADNANAAIKEAASHSADELKKIEHDKYRKLLESSNDWRDGMRAVYADLKRDHTTWSRFTYDLTKKTFDNMEAAFSDSLYKTMKGDWDDLGDVWQNFCDSMLKTFADMITQMLLEWAKTEIFGASVGGGGGSSGGSGWLSYLWGWIGGGGGGGGTEPSGGGTEPDIDWDGAYYQTGAWKIPEDQYAHLDKGEMVIPAKYAELIRLILARQKNGSGVYVGPGGVMVGSDTSPSVNFSSGYSSTTGGGRSGGGGTFSDSIAFANFGAKDAIAAILALISQNPVALTLSALNLGTKAAKGYGKASALDDIAEQIVNDITSVLNIFNKFGDDVTQAVEDTAENIVSDIRSMGDDVSGVFDSFGNDVTIALDSFATDIVADIRSMGDDFGDSLSIIGDTAVATSEGIAGFIAGMGDGFGLGGVAPGDPGGSGGDGGDGGDGGGGGGDGGYGGGGDGAGEGGGYAIGSNYIPYDMTTKVHRGERIFTEVDNKEIVNALKGGSGGIGEIKIYLDGQEVSGRMKVIVDGVIVDRNRSGINPGTRIYQ